MKLFIDDLTRYSVFGALTYAFRGKRNIGVNNWINTIKFYAGFSFY